MAAKIAAPVNEMMKYSPTAYCALHICVTSLYVIHREKTKRNAITVRVTQP